MGRLLWLRRSYHIFMLKQCDRQARYSCEKQDIARSCVLIFESTEKKSVHSYWNFKQILVY